MIATLKREGFYGELHLTFRNGALTRMVVEQSQVFNSNSNGRTPDEQYISKQQ
jgi:hypothetical protein